MLTDEEAVAGTLAWCNEIRAEKGQEPLTRLPKGKRVDPYSCPCGRATGVFVEGRYYADSREAFRAGRMEPVPVAVTDFIIKFDDGDLPEYDEDPKWSDLDEEP